MVLTSLLLVMWSGGMVLIADLNRPRIGSIRVDPAPMVWAIQGFDAPDLNAPGSQNTPSADAGGPNATR